MAESVLNSSGSLKPYLDGSQGTRIIGATGGVATVTNGKLDVNATVSTTGLATDTNQTNGAQKTQIVDAGGDAVTVTGGKLDVNASIDTTGLALAANQQTDALTNTQLRASPVPVSGPLTDTELRATAVPISGTVTANAGTNLNTSALALEAGGNLAAIKGKTDNIPALGQALAAGSVPVVLTAAQVTTLTPPAAITNYANETGGNLAAIKTKTDNLDVLLSTRLKPADTLTKVATVDTITNVVHVDDNAGSLTVDGTVAVTADAVEIANNSSTTPLAGNATFTGTGIDMDPYASISVSVFADQASAANGLKVQWSNDNSNWDFSDQQTYAASVGNMITFGRKARYARVVFTNGATPQGAFRLQTACQRFAVRQTRKFVGNAVVDQDTGQVVIAALQGHSTAGGGSWVDVKVNPSGALTAAVTAADGDVFVRSNAAATFPVTAVQGTGTNLHTVVDSGSITATQATGTNLHTVVDSGTISTITNVVHVDDNSGSLTMDYATTGSGTATGALRVEVANNGTGVIGLNTGTNSIGKISDITTSVVPGTGATNLGKAEDAAHTTGDTGVAVWAVRDDTIGATSGTEGDYEALHTNENGALWTELSPSTKGGLTVGNFNTGDGFTALTNSAQVIKGSAGKLYGYYIMNPNTATSYVMVYNVAAAIVTVGTTGAAMIFAIPGGAAANLALPYGIPFSTAMSCAAATTGGGNTAPTTALEVMFFYT